MFINAQINNLLNVTCVSLNCNLCNVHNKYYYVKRQDKSISLIVITGKSYLLIRKLTLSCILYPQQRKIGTYTFMMPLQNLKAMTLTYNCLFSCLLLSFFYIIKLNKIVAKVYYLSYNNLFRKSCLLSSFS